MPSTRTWVGSAAPLAKVISYAFAGTWIIGETITVAYGNRSWTYTTTSTSIPVIIAGLVAAYNALSASVYPEFREVTASGAATPMLFTAVTAGRDFIPVITTNSAVGTITPTTTQQNSGPNDWRPAANWSGGVAPVTGDTAIIDKIGTQIFWGLDQSAVTLAVLNINTPLTDNAFQLGLPKQNTGSGTPYAEYRPDYLQIGATSCKITTRGGRTKIAFGSVQTAVEVFSSGSTSEQGVPSILLTGTHASNTLEASLGIIGVAFFGGEVSTFLTTLQGKQATNNDTVITFGSGVTLGTITKTAGTLTINSAVATALSCAGGTTTINGTGAVAQLDGAGGERVIFNTTGTLGGNAVMSGGALLDCSQDQSVKTVTNVIKCYDSADVADPNKVITNLRINYVKTGRGLIGTDYTITRS